LRALATTAADHPILIGAFLVFMFLSSAAHLLIFSVDLALALSKHLREQAVDVLGRKRRVSRDLREWLLVLSDRNADRIESMSEEQLDSELRRLAIDSEISIEMVTALVRAKMDRLGENGEDPKRK
jgi:hypothetical protein